MSENKKILVVDDEEHIRLLYSEELISAKYEVATAENTASALEKIKSENIDLVVLDIMMPDMDGLEALSRIKKMNKNLPVILCTAYGSYKQDFIAWGAEAYIVKSSNVKELISTVKKCLGKTN